MTAGKVKNPISYAIGLAKKAKDGLLTAPVEKTVLKVVDNKKQAFIQRNFDKLKTQLVNADRTWISHPTFDGWIYAADLDDFKEGTNHVTK